MGKPSRGRQARRQRRKAKQQRKKAAKQPTGQATTSGANHKRPARPRRTVRWVQPPQVANHELRGELEVLFPTPLDPVGRIELDLLVRFEEGSFPARWWNAAVYDPDGGAVLSGGWEPGDPIGDQIPWEDGTDDPYLDLLEAFFKQPTERHRMKRLLRLLKPPTQG